MTLHPKALKLLKAAAESGIPPWPEMEPQRAREIFASFTALFGEGPAVRHVEDFLIGEALPIRVYWPAARVEDQRLPALAYFHGGGWVLGNIETHDALCRKLANAAQRTVVSVDYRLAPDAPYPAAVDDCYSVMRWIAEHAADLGVTPENIGVAGDSAGGNLAAAVALRSAAEHGPIPDAAVLIYPVIEPNFETGSYRAFAQDHGLSRETMRWFWDQYVGDNPTAEYAALMQRPLEGMPPTFVLTAEYDVLRDEGEAFARRLDQASRPIHSKRYAGMLHGFVHYGGFFPQHASQAVDDIAEFLRSI